MSKRLQVLLPEEEFEEIRQLSQDRSITVAELVRESLRNYMKGMQPKNPSEKLAKVLAYAKYSAPTGDIEDILSEIDAGKNR